MPRTELEAPDRDRDVIRVPPDSRDGLVEGDRARELVEWRGQVPDAANVAELSARPIDSRSERGRAPAGRTVVIAPEHVGQGFGQDARPGPGAVRRWNRCRGVGAVEKVPGGRLRIPCFRRLNAMSTLADSRHEIRSPGPRRES